MGRIRTAVFASAALWAGAAVASPAQDYLLYCMGCHGAQAQGVPGKIPALAVNLARFMNDPAGRNYLLRVPGAANSALPDAQLAAVLNWLSTAYPAPEGGTPHPITTEEVARLRHTPLANVQQRRREVIAGIAASGRTPPASY
jgi:cytochrome c553